MYSYLILKTDLNNDTYINIYHINPKDYPWVLWLIIGIIFICLLIFVILILKNKKASEELFMSSHHDINDSQPPVNAYQPPVHHYES